MIAEIMKVKGGARAIATMTFDDGHPRTSRKLNELLAKYGGRASLMLYCRKSLANDEEINLWREITGEGYLAVENHSMTHDYLTSNPNYTKPEHLCEEKYLYETKESLTMLRSAFPGQDVLSFTIPYANYVPDARRHVIATHYAALAGECVLTDPDNEGKMQSLDPEHADPATGMTPAGTWHNVYYARLQPIYADTVYPQLTMDNIVGYLDRCVRDEGWFITSCHGIYKGENQDLTEEDLETLLSAMSDYVKENKLWIASFTDAVKYIRERQSSTLTVKDYGDRYGVEITLADTTPDGLSLKDKVKTAGDVERLIFNMPLTVKIELDPEWDAVKCTRDGVSSVAATFVVDGVKYAYVDILPCGGETIIERYSAL